MSTACRPADARRTVHTCWQSRCRQVDLVKCVDLSCVGSRDPVPRCGECTAYLTRGSYRLRSCTDRRLQLVDWVTATTSSHHAETNETLAPPAPERSPYSTIVLALLLLLLLKQNMNTLQHAVYARNGRLETTLKFSRYLLPHLL